MIDGGLTIPRLWRPYSAAVYSKDGGRENTGHLYVSWSYSQTVLPFAIEITPGGSIAEQIIFAVKRAVVSGRLRAGDRFPSVRGLSQELRINPTTAHRVITALVDEGVLVTTPTVGTVVAESAPGTSEEKSEILGVDLQKLVVEAKRRGIGLEQLRRALDKHWRDFER